MTSKSGAARAIVTVHGTWAGDRNEIKPRWWEKNSAFCESLIGENPHNTEPADIHEFIWSGENSFLYREAATNALIEFLAPLSKEYNQIDIIAHSHGGNIVSNALYANKKKSEAALANVRNVVSVARHFLVAAHHFCEGLQSFSSALAKFTPSCLLSPFCILVLS